MAEAKKDEVATTAPQAMAAPAPMPADLVRDRGRGTEAIGQDDVRPPRILICQSGSPQRKPGNTKQIPGLNELDIFNDLSGENYGQGPLKFVVITSLGHRHIQFAPMDEGGGVIDFNVPDGDPRTQFTTGTDGERVKPVATKFYDYLVWLPDQSELAALSMKSTQLKVAIRLNGLLKLPLKLDGRVLIDPPAWARTFSVTSVMDQRDNYAWGNYNLKLEGVTPADVRETCAKLADVYGKKNIVIERDLDDEPGFVNEPGASAVEDM